MVRSAVLRAIDMVVSWCFMSSDQLTCVCTLHMLFVCIYVHIGVCCGLCKKRKSNRTDGRSYMVSVYPHKHLLPSPAFLKSASITACTCTTQYSLGADLAYCTPTV